MTTRTILIDGVAKRYVRDLVIGDRVDLEGDTFADPYEDPDASENPEFQFEFQTVALVECETDDCTRVDFEAGFSCGFPPDHLVDVDGEQPDRVVRCPDGPDPLGGDIVGCGATFHAEPDDEGLVDCPNCGIVFNPDREG